MAKELTKAQKRLIYRNPDLGTYRFNPPAVCCEKWIEDDWLTYISIWEPNEEFWKLQATWWIEDQYAFHYQDYTLLAIECANTLEHPEWLDDTNHWIWDKAKQYIRTYNDQRSKNV